MNYLRFLAAFFILSVCFSCKTKGTTDPTPSLYVKIPDINFEKKLIELKIDDVQDGQVLRSSVEMISRLVISNTHTSGTFVQITNLDGIEAFTNLKELFCSSLNLSSLNINKNINLRVLSCTGNQLSNLDISKNTNLDSLDCSNNNLKNLITSQNIRLKYLDCLNNQLGNLEISKNINLERLSFSMNQLTGLDVSKNINLKYFFCSYNQFKTLDISKNIALQYLNCTNNKIQTICVNNLNQPKINWYKDPTATYKICN